ncbi:MAG: dTDP-4-dehydrorhamnose reductase [Bacteroidales bacterium]|jgi:dTDP-4-dehydrorhamnose reductase|nr:dTDP-4-dehydrorhamnose reductase [Bacteroidales bacterium]
MSKILVTGANGQLGNELRLLSEKHIPHHFFFTDVEELDITDYAAVEHFFLQHHIEIVINCAAYTAVDKAEEDKKAAFSINATAVENLARACIQRKAKLIHISTDYVYDGTAYLPYKEDHPTAPVSVYGQSKLAGETAALTVSDCIIIRTSWLYSSFGNNFVKTMLRLGKEREVLNVVSDQVGTPTYAADLAATIMVIVEKAAANQMKLGVFNFSNEGVCSWYDFAHEIMRLSGLKCMVQPIETKDYPAAATRPYYSVLNKTAIKTAYGIKINHWQDSLEKCLSKLLDK